MAFWALGPGMGVVTRGPVGSSGKKGVSVDEEESNAAVAAAPRRESVVDARVRIETRAGGVRRLSERSPREVRRSVAMTEMREGRRRRV